MTTGRKLPPHGRRGDSSRENEHENVEARPSAEGSTVPLRGNQECAHSKKTHARVANYKLHVRPARGGAGFRVWCYGEAR